MAGSAQSARAADIGTGQSHELCPQAMAEADSLIETAKANGIEPYAYLKTVFTELPQATTVEQIEALLPVPADDDILAKVS